VEEIVNMFCCSFYFSTECQNVEGLWSEDPVKGAMAAMREGTPANRASSEINNPRRTSRNHTKTGQSRKKLGRRTCSITPKEKQLYSRIFRLQDTNMPVTLKMLK
jgi:hypothetical protein